MTSLINYTFSVYCRYPSAFIYTYYRKLLINHQPKSMRALPLIYTGDTYDKARRAILQLSTASQSQHNRNTRNIAIDSNNSAENVVAEMIDQQSTRIPNPSRPYQPKLILHYQHERRLCRYKKDIHQLWSKTFTKTPLPPTKLIVGHRNHSNLKRELVRKKPKLRLRHKPSPKQP